MHSGPVRAETPQPSVGLDAAAVRQASPQMQPAPFRGLTAATPASVAGPMLLAIQRSYGNAATVRVVQRAYLGANAEHGAAVGTGEAMARIWIQDAVRAAERARDCFLNGTEANRPFLDAYEGVFGEVTDRAEIEFVLGNLEASINQDWTIIDDDAPIEGVIARTRWDEDAEGQVHNVHIRVGPGFYGLGEWEQQQTLFHEFQHAGWQADDGEAPMTSAYGYEAFIATIAAEDDLDVDSSSEEGSEAGDHEDMSEHESGGGSGGGNDTDL